MKKSLLLVLVAVIVAALALTGCGSRTAFQAEQIRQLTSQVASMTVVVGDMQEEIDAQTDRADALQAEIVNQDNQLYQLNLVANPRQLLVNYDEAMKGYEDRLVGEDAQGYAYNNLADNVIPMLYDMVQGRDLPRGSIEKRIARLEKYVVDAENIGGNEGEDTKTLNAIKDLKVQLKSF